MKSAVLSFLLLATWVAPAAAQVTAPTLVEEDLPERAPATPGLPAPAGRDRPSPAPRSGGHPTRSGPSEPRIGHPPPPGQPAPAAARTSPVAEPPSAASSPDTSALVRPIEPVRARPEDLIAAWQERRLALKQQDQDRVSRAEARLLELKKELGLESLDDLAAAELRASAIESRSRGEALARAELAVALAPDLPEAYWALARARLGADGSKVRGGLTALAAGIAAVGRAPAVARGLAADVLAAGLVAGAATAALALVLLLARRLRVVLHDFRHLPLIRHATPLQATFLALVLLAAPLALRLGPAALLAVFAIAAAMHLAPGERLVASAALVVVALLPWGAEQAARAAAFPGTLAADVHEVEGGAGDAAAVARIEARALRGDVPAAALLALGRYHKRRGHLDEALRRYREVGATRAEALVGIGNVRLLQGDADGAKAAYGAAVDAATAARDARSLAAAHYDLSKVLLRQSALEQSQRARESAALEDPALLARYGSDEDFRANRWLIDVPVPASDLPALAGDELPRELGAAVLARLAAPLPPAAWPWVPLVLAAALWPLALLRRWGPPGHACERCGRTACRRCDGVTGGLCGQCVNVFLERAAVDPHDRQRKERQAWRHAMTRRGVARALALVGGGAGHLWRGEALRGALLLLALLFLAALAATWSGVVPVRHPARWLTAGKSAVALFLAVAVWAWTVRDVFRRTRG